MLVTVEVTSLQSRCLTVPLRSLPFFGVSHSVFKTPILVSPFQSIRRKSCCLASSSSDTLVVGSRKEDGKESEVVSKKEDEFGELKYWMHKNGLPPCKVVLEERPSHDEKHKPIHYIAASEDLQVVVNFMIHFGSRLLNWETYWSSGLEINGGL